VFGAIKAWEWWNSPTPPGGRARRRPSTPLVVVLALASFGSSITHAAVGPEHLREAAAFGVFFVVAAALQAAWAVLVIRRADPLLLAIGAAGNSAVLVLWAITRTVGLPIGPQIWHPEAVSAPDLFASLLEVTIIVGSTWLVSRDQRLPRPDRRTRACAPLDLVAP
jgi:hypothetical protein